MDLEVYSLAQRPELVPLLDDFVDAWPEFMAWDPIASLYYAVADEVYPEFVLVAVDPADPGRALARAYSVPLAWPDDQPLPPGGWDRVVQRATINRLGPSSLRSGRAVSTPDPTRP